MDYSHSYATFLPPIRNKEQMLTHCFIVCATDRDPAVCYGLKLHSECYSPKQYACYIVRHVTTQCCRLFYTLFWLMLISTLPSPSVHRFLSKNKNCITQNRQCTRECTTHTKAKQIDIEGEKLSFPNTFLYSIQHKHLSKSTLQIVSTIQSAKSVHKKQRPTHKSIFKRSQTGIPC